MTHCCSPLYVHSSVPVKSESCCDVETEVVVLVCSLFYVHVISESWCDVETEVVMLHLVKISGATVLCLSIPRLRKTIYMILT